MSAENRKFIFIVNPNSGKQRLIDWSQMVSQHLPSKNYEILFTTHPGHTGSILSDYQHVDDSCVIAVGGDGTVSELIPFVLNHKYVLGIIPMGSGNGLARHLKIPLRTAAAIQKLSSGKASLIDLIQVNDRFCSNTCGIGFTALITRYFGLKGQRGFNAYLKLALKLYQTSERFDLMLDEVLYKDIWMIEFANSSQLGNDTYVSPHASVTDGIMDILIVKRPKIWQVPGFMLQSLFGKILKSSLTQLLQAKEVKIKLYSEQNYHIDGEYQGMIKELHLKILPSALQVIQ
jgi:YegS/Rv2252/BmrU family lipid kinase